MSVRFMTGGGLVVIVVFVGSLTLGCLLLVFLRLTLLSIAEPSNGSGLSRNLPMNGL